jgi:peptidoglycan/LPS O-acetylase OafA/YrhL
MTALSVLAGWLLYRMVETPFMALRDRLVPSNFAADGAPDGTAAITPSR